MPLERVWSGNDLTSNWDKSHHPTAFWVELAIDPYYEKHLITNPVVSLQKKHGVAYKNEPFTIRNGKMDFAESKIEFDMIPENKRQPAKLFKGTLVKDKAGKDYVAIHGTIRLHPIWLTGQSQEVYSAYKGYKATVTLR